MIKYCSGLNHFLLPKVPPNWVKILGSAYAKVQSPASLFPWSNDHPPHHHYPTLPPERYLQIFYRDGIPREWCRAKSSYEKTRSAILVLLVIVTGTNISSTVFNPVAICLSELFSYHQIPFRKLISKRPIRDLSMWLLLLVSSSPPALSYCVL